MAEFKEYTSTVGEGNEQRTVTVKARESHGDETVQTTGGPVNVNKGDYVVTTDNPNVFDVVSKESWNKNPFKAATSGGTR